MQKERLMKINTVLAVTLLGILSGCASKNIQAAIPTGNPIVQASAPAFEVASVRRTGQPGPPGDIPENGVGHPNVSRETCLDCVTSRRRDRPCGRGSGP